MEQVSFVEVITKLSNQSKIKALSYILQFPKNKTLNEEYAEPQLTISTGLFDLDTVKGTIKKNVKLISLNAVEEINVVLDNVELLNKTVRIDQFDNIQINRNGVSLLRIMLDENDVKKSVIIDIARYHKECLKINEKDGTSEMLLAMALVLLFVCMFVYIIVNEFKKFRQ